jgi:AraC family transcriptional regulator
MTMAAFELQSTDCKIIDLAMKYGYESSDAFCVAFKKMHGVAPITARQQNIKLKSFSRLSFSLTIKGDVEMNYRIAERENFLVTGKIITSSLENNITPEFWNECKKNGTVDRLVEIGVNPCTLGVCFGYNDEGFNDYMVGIETVSDKYVGLTTVIIPKSKWLVFESVGPVNPTLGETWTRIYSEFLPQSIYKQAALPTIEKYFGNDSNSDTYYVEIWISIITEG